MHNNYSYSHILINVRYKYCNLNIKRNKICLKYYMLRKDIIYIYIYSIYINYELWKPLYRIIREIKKQKKLVYQ